MKSKEGEKLRVYNSVMRKFLFESLGIGIILTKFKEKSFDIDFSIYFLLVLVAIDIVIFLIRFALGRYAKVVFDKKGFSYKKYFASEFVPWDKVKSVEEVRIAPRKLMFYLIRFESREGEREYLIEKYIDTAKLMDLLYYNIDEPKFKYRFIEYKIKTGNQIMGADFIGFFAILICFLAFLMEFISLYTFGIIALAVLLASVVASVILYNKNKNTDDRFKANKEGVMLTINGREHFIKWDDAKNIYHETENLSSSKYDILRFEVDENIAGKDNTIRIPVSHRLLEEVYLKRNYDEI